MIHKDRPTTKDARALIQKVGDQESRKIKAQQDATESVWSGFGMFGIIGWSIVVPTLLGVAIGAWLDGSHPGDFSWTLALLVAGLMVGCGNAWHWVSKENRSIHEGLTEPKDENNAK